MTLVLWIEKYMNLQARVQLVISRRSACMLLFSAILLVVPNLTVSSALERHASLDIDGNGDANALTDGQLILRHMFGVSGISLVFDATAPDALYVTSEDIEARIRALDMQLDIDQNGQVDALTDGLLILRYLLGMRGTNLVRGVVADNSVRGNISTIESYMEGLTHPPNDSTPSFSSVEIFAAEENQLAIGMVRATDPDNDTLTFSVTGFELAITSDGILTFVLEPDYEIKSTYAATVSVTDGHNIMTQDIVVTVKDVDEPPLLQPPLDQVKYDVLSTRTLKADGVIGADTYDLIREFGGARCIESPDLYHVNHPEVSHIVEARDQTVGDHFVFKIHRDLDRDRDRLDITDRQRNEIKTYGPSEDAVKAFEGETLILRWRFKITEGFELSKRFSHFFQLKAVGGNDSHPILTITGNEQSGADGYEIRHGEEDTKLARVSRDKVDGKWLDAYVRATFSHVGSLRLIVVDTQTKDTIFDISAVNIDMWRGTSESHFVRPKWGIYRSLADIDNLRQEEEIVRFADFEIQKVMPR